MAIPSEIPPASPEEARERRRSRRIGTRIEGRIVFAGVDVDCIVHEMSATGATVECVPLPALGAEIALDVPDVGCARGVAIRHEGDLVCIELTTTPSQRDRMSDRLILAAFRFPPEDPAD
jgi:hypothetical protein